MHQVVFLYAVPKERHEVIPLKPGSEFGQVKELQGSMVLNSNFETPHRSDCSSGVYLKMTGL
ncbi:hypothetical protein CS542_02195 [Pedobacter sp. IW39]|nr:hypothetical protein CS542_02195 [Pedobacter sp. IW39]